MNRRIFVQLPLAAAVTTPKTTVGIRGDMFLINGEPTYRGRTYQGKKIEGLLMNTRMVQGIFDDMNSETAMRWAYPDTKKWDAERNVREFMAAMPLWKQHGVLAFTINLQGGSPEGYSKAQPWHTSAIAETGELRPAFMARLERILDRADQLGMVAIVGYYYFGQDQRMKDEAAVKRGVTNATQWLLDKKYRNVLVEIDNECDVKSYDHAILMPERVHELISHAKGMAGGRLLVGTSYRGGAVPTPNVVKVSDFLLIHGNGVKDPRLITKMVQDTRKLEGYRPMPILFNEDDHFDFDQPSNNMINAINEYASWGYFDPEGYQCPPVTWGIDTPRKKAYFEFNQRVTGIRTAK
jgi:hypothetical protein